VRALRLRGHHLVCLNFLTEAFDSAFTALLREMRERALAGEEVEVIEGVDELCSRCPMLADGACEFEEEVREMDADALEALGLRVGDRVRMEEVREKLKGLKEWLDGFCEGCEFQSTCEREKETFFSPA